MDSREIVRRVLAFGSPERIGLTFTPGERTPRLNDVHGGGPDAIEAPKAEWVEGNYLCRQDEWGNVWAKVDSRHSGEVIRGAIQQWEALDDYEAPPLDDPQRYIAVSEAWSQDPEYYHLGTIPGCAFNVTRYMRGFEQFLLDCAAEPKQVDRLNTMVADIVERVVDVYATCGADGVFFCEDWGTQERLLVSPAMWRRLFLPHFERLVSHAHEHGIAVWMHSCGYIWEAIPDLIACGLDVLQFDQQENYPLERLAEHFAGRITFWCPVDIQKILQTQERNVIQAYAKKMRRLLGDHGGGFIAKDYSDWKALGITQDEQQWAYEAFLEVAPY
jgi:uroporphyrinogen decarboxylase